MLQPPQPDKLLENRNLDSADHNLHHVAGVDFQSALPPARGERRDVCLQLRDFLHKGPTYSLPTVARMLLPNKKRQQGSMALIHLRCFLSLGCVRQDDSLPELIRIVTPESMIFDMGLLEPAHTHKPWEHKLLEKVSSCVACCFLFHGFSALYFAESLEKPARDHLLPCAKATTT